jgi:photosystem II stability/assembly factor-like uncharacterized protein
VLSITTLTKYTALLFLLAVKISAGIPIMYTSDGGENWSLEESNTYFNLNDVSVSIATGTAIADGDHGVVLRREDNGTWADVSPVGLTMNLYSVAVGVSGIMACGARGTLLSSFDNGRSWRVWAEFGQEDISLLSVNFDPTHTNSFLITGEDGFIYSPADGVVTMVTDTDIIGSCGKLCGGIPEVVLGRNGTGYFVENSEGFTVGDVELRGTTEIVSGGSRYMAAGEGGCIYRYEAEGEWERMNSGTSEDLNDISFLSWGTTVCAVGDNGTVLISKDNGISWRRIDSAIHSDLNAVSGNGSGIAFIVG